ncbi:alpha-E domain-containing protein [Paracidovorax oryzae]|uniref:alpha-E domain-containing protein n=1 Tax=Paracidovorax oryzae TaxID=862720 RepID=UPI00384CBA10
MPTAHPPRACRSPWAPWPCRSRWEGNEMLSRTADHLFWMSRYTERAETRAAGAHSQKYCLRAQRVRGFLPGEDAC